MDEDERFDVMLKIQKKKEKKDKDKISSLKRSITKRNRFILNRNLGLIKM